MKMVIRGMKGKTAEMMQAAFAYACKKEGIENEPYTVDLKYVPQSECMLGVGCTKNVVHLRVSEPIEMRISSQAYKYGGVPAVMETFLHEMVHVRQIVKRQLVIGPGYTAFHGVKYPQREIELYKRGRNPELIPWEVEAYANAHTEPEGFFKTIGRSDLMDNVTKIPMEKAKDFAAEMLGNNQFRRPW